MATLNVSCLHVPISYGEGPPSFFVLKHLVFCPASAVTLDDNETLLLVYCLHSLIDHNI